jgi:hypothetical protein
MNAGERFFVFCVDATGKDVFVAKDGGLTPDLAEADLNTEDIADDLAVLVSAEFDMCFGIGQDVSSWEA